MKRLLAWFPVGEWTSIASLTARVLWCLPFVLCFFPDKIRDEIPGAGVSRVVHFLIDDSESMTVAQGGLDRQAFSDSLLRDARDVCMDLGCEIKPTYLSATTGEKKFSRLGEGLRGWWITTGQDPWVLVSDGGDSTQSSGDFLRNARLSAGKGLIVGFESVDRGNLYFDSVSIPPYAFEGRPAEIAMEIARADGETRDLTLPSEKTQIQVRSGDQVLGAVDISFAAGDVVASGRMVLPSLPRGEQPLQLVILPSPGEVMTWDNDYTADIEVLPNTIGLLHLLGTPGWDGRFFRRMVKAEPKFDLISFFILRDPWDNLEVSDRELSLIPFPAERLFKEELNSFRVLVLQDFTLARFLQPDYQENLVQFVKNGGGLFFIGGGRALQEIDMASSPLGEILPFVKGAERLVNYPDADRGPAGADIPGGAGRARNSGLLGSSAEGLDKLGAGYQANQKFKIEFASPTREQRELASVYDDWRSSVPDLVKIQSMKGLHDIPARLIDEKRTTPLLVAKSSGGEESPLAVASFPGKGRALWLLSDSFWRLALAESSGVARETYDRFMLSGLQWLMRQDLRKPLVLSRFGVKLGSTQNSGSAASDRAMAQWTATLSGPAVGYLAFDDSRTAAVTNSEKPISAGSFAEVWTLSVCGKVLSRDEISITRVGTGQLILSGSMPVEQMAGLSQLRQVSGKMQDIQGNSHLRPYCQIQLEATSKAFGSVKASGRTFVQVPLSDDSVLDSISWLHKVQALDLSRTEMMMVGTQKPYLSRQLATVSLGRWLAENAVLDAVAASENAAIGSIERPSRDDPYWPFKRWWSWALLAMMPVEVFLRRVVRTRP